MMHASGGGGRAWRKAGRRKAGVLRRKRRRQLATIVTHHHLEEGRVLTGGRAKSKVAWKACTETEVVRKSIRRRETGAGNAAKHLLRRQKIARRRQKLLLKLERRLELLRGKLQ